MQARNLLFFFVCVGSVLLFVASVFPPADAPSPRVTWNRAAIEPVAHGVDAAFEQLWSEQNLTPAPPASDLAVARRISLALTGTIPSLEEIRRFESEPADGRLDRWLGERLADRRYADYVGERLARAYVGVDDGPFLLYRRRRFVAWLADQLAANVSYDLVVEHLIADRGLWTDTPATNFITVAIKPDQSKDPDANLLASRVARAFLGVRLDCAECHDHPFEPWKQRDFQSLAAFFGNTRQGLRGIGDVRGDCQVENRLTGQLETVACDVPFQRELLAAEGSDRQRLARWVTHRDNRQFAREAVNRAWAILIGRPLVDPIDNLSPSAPLPPALEILASDFADHGYDWQRLLEVIVSTRVFRQDSRLASGEVTPAHETHWAVFPLVRLRSEQVVGALLQSASLSTIDSGSHILVRLARAAGQRDFVERYGDGGAEEFSDHGGTIPQRLLLMNGQLVEQKTKDDLLSNAATQIAVLAPNDDTAIETAMLAILSRRPTPEELAHFRGQLADTGGKMRNRRLSDLYWTLLNSTEFSWNH